MAKSGLPHHLVLLVPTRSYSAEVAPIMARQDALHSTAHDVSPQDWYTAWYEARCKSHLSLEVFIFEPSPEKQQQLPIEKPLCSGHLVSVSAKADTTYCPERADLPARLWYKETDPPSCSTALIFEHVTQSTVRLLNTALELILLPETPEPAERLAMLVQLWLALADVTKPLQAAEEPPTPYDILVSRDVLALKKPPPEESCLFECAWAQKHLPKAFNASAYYPPLWKLQDILEPLDRVGMHHIATKKLGRQALPPMLYGLRILEEFLGSDPTTRKLPVQSSKLSAPRKPLFEQVWGQGYQGSTSPPPKSPQEIYVLPVFPPAPSQGDTIPSSRLPTRVREATTQESYGNAAEENGQTERGTAANVFRKEGDFWLITYQGETARLKSTKGLHYIAYLLRQPGQEIHVTQMVASLNNPPAAPNAGIYGGMSEEQLAEENLRMADLGNAGELLDQKAIDKYRRHLDGLSEDLKEAKERNDLGRIETLQAEKDWLTAQLASALGLGGMARVSSSHGERARSSVTKAIKTAIGKIGKENSALQNYLSSTIETGLFCAYNPPTNDSTSWTL